MNKYPHSNNIPKPIPPTQRHEKLPWQAPKSKNDDENCDVSINKIMAHPSYQPAMADLDYLASDNAREIRLQIDYSKPEQLLKEQGIQHTIVVFGSTRINEPSAARRKVVELQKSLSEQQDNTALQKRLSVAERLLAKSHYYTVARELSQLVVKAGNGPNDSRLVVMTGGGPGIMEAANRGAYDLGAKTIGLNITLPHEQFPNPYITPGLCFQFHYFALRKMHFLLRAKALVALPGGFGTFDELFETLTLIQTRKLKPVPVVLVGEEYWRKVFDVDFMVDEGVIDEEDRDLFWYAETAEEAWQGINTWYKASEEELIESLPSEK